MQKFLHLIIMELKIHWLSKQRCFIKYLPMYYVYIILFKEKLNLQLLWNNSHWCYWLGRPESLNTTLNTTIDSAMIEPQIEPQIIQTKLASQGQQMAEQQMLVQNNTDLAHGGSVSEKATEILNGWEGYVRVTVCVSRKCTELSLL